MVKLMQLILITLLLHTMGFSAVNTHTSEEKNTLTSLLLADNFDFCGERIPVERPEVSERLLAEIAKRKRFKQESIDFIRRAGRYQQVFLNIMRKTGVPDDFFYLSLAESGLTNAVSHKGALGFWQFMDYTAPDFGLEISGSVDERIHPEKATAAACRFFKQSYRTFGNWSLVATSYNMGITGLLRQVKEQGTTNLFDLDLNEESQNYIYRVVSIKYLLEHPEHFDIHVNPRDLLAPIPSKIITVKNSIHNLSDFAKQHEMHINDLRMLNPWLTANNLVAKPGKTYHIRIPLRKDFVAEELITDSVRRMFAERRRELAEAPDLLNSRF